jgi:hypothetical protein
MNAHAERFNRTIQESFVDYHEEVPKVLDSYRQVAIAHGPVAGFEGILVHGVTVSNSNPTTRRVSRLNSMPTR